MIRRIASSLILIACFASFSAAQEPAEGTATKEHAVLKKFVGKWTSESEGTMGPGQPPMQCTGKLDARMLGQFFVVNELEGDAMGTQIKALQTIGYNSEKKKYVGTWVDNMMEHVWHYEGTFDEATQTLSLMAEGPNFAEPGKKAMFRDSYKFESEDEIAATSAMQSADGEWVVFMSGKITRVK